VHCLLVTVYSEYVGHISHRGDRKKWKDRKFCGLRQIRSDELVQEIHGHDELEYTFLTYIS